jgi:hypothetical protein
MMHLHVGELAWGRGLVATYNSLQNIGCKPLFWQQAEGFGMGFVGSLVLWGLLASLLLIVMGSGLAMLDYAVGKPPSRSP